jgi:3'(2'), 5'-bisphosphate nucleotidase
LAQPIIGVASKSLESVDATPVSSVQDDGELAAWLAGRAGVELLKLRDALGFGDPRALKDAGDRQSHELLTAELARLRPNDAVLSEEGRDDPVRLTADRVWIIDPLDGTREFGEDGRADWAVHVALWSSSAGSSSAGSSSAGSRGDLVAGAVSLPAAGTVYSTAGPNPALGEVGDPIRIAASRTRPPAFFAGLCSSLGAVEVPMGSAGAKIIAVVSGAVDAYVHAGGQYEWDSAAPVAVARAAGLHTSRIDGSPLTYNRADPTLPDLLVCRPELAPRILGYLQAASTDS